MKQRIICKTLAVAVIILFIGLAIQPSVAVQTETERDIEPKNYLFQTIIDIANNPKVKNLLEKYDNDLLNIDIDRSFYRRLFLRHPKLLFYMLFTKPSISVELLDKCYNKVIEITNILGEHIVLETIENVDITNKEFFDEIHSIISKNEEISSRLETLKEVNKEINPITPFEDIICPIAYSLFLLFCILTIFFLPIDIIAEAIDMISNPILKGILMLVILPIYIPILILYRTIVFPIFLISYYLMEEYDCLPYAN